MTFTLDQAFIKSYGAGVEMLSQQKVSKLLPLVRKETKPGEIVFFNRIEESGGMDEITDRKVGAEFRDEVHSRRGVVSKLFTKKLGIDKIDEFKMDVNMRSTYQESLAAVIGRKIDDIIIAAATGSALTGKEGAGTQALPSGQKVAKTFGATDGMTVEKLVEIARIFDANEVDASEKRYLILNAKAKAQLLNQTAVTSADYNSVKALVNGQINSFMGFEFIHSERLGNDENSDGYVLALTEKALILNMPKPVEVRIDENVNLNYLWQLQGFLTAGAVRMDDERVVTCAYDKTL